MSLAVKSHVIHGIQVLSLTGRFVYGPELNNFDRAAFDALRNSSQLIVDLTSVELLDDHGISALMALLQTARNRSGDVRLILRSESNVVSRVIHLTRLDEVFRVFSNDMDAVGSYDEIFTRAVAV